MRVCLISFFVANRSYKGVWISASFKEAVVSSITTSINAFIVVNGTEHQVDKIDPKYVRLPRERRLISLKEWKDYIGKTVEVVSTHPEENRLDWYVKKKKGVKEGVNYVAVSSWRGVVKKAMGKEVRIDYDEPIVVADRTPGDKTWAVKGNGVCETPIKETMLCLERALNPLFESAPGEAKSTPEQAKSSQKSPSKRQSATKRKSPRSQKTENTQKSPRSQKTENTQKPPRSMQV